MAKGRSSRLILLVALVACIGWPVVYIQADGAPANGPAVTSPRQIAQDDAVRGRLRTPVIVRFNHTPISSALQTLARAAHVNIFVYWHALAADGCSPSTPITVQFRHPVTVATGLRFSLLAIHIDGPSPLSYSVQRGVLMVGPRNVLATHVVTRCYRLGPLLPKASPGHPVSPKLLQARIILRALEHVIYPARWVDNGGTAIQARVVDSLLFVTAAENTQWKIERLLAKLAKQIRRQNEKSGGGY